MTLIATNSLNWQDENFFELKVRDVENVGIKCFWSKDQT